MVAARAGGEPETQAPVDEGALLARRVGAVLLEEHAVCIRQPALAGGGQSGDDLLLLRGEGGARRVQERRLEVAQDLALGRRGGKDGRHLVAARFGARCAAAVLITAGLWLRLLHCGLL